MSMKLKPFLSRRLLTSILVSTTLVAVSACAVTQEPTCDDTDFSELSGEITITGIVGIRIMRHNDDLTWSQAWSQANDTTATPAESLRIHIELDKLRQQQDNSTANQKPEKTAWQQLGNLLRLAVNSTLISPAYACEATNRATLDSKIVGMNLISSEQYRDNTAGDSLGSEFTVSMIPFDGIDPNNAAYWYRPITINNILSAKSTTFRPAATYRFEPSVRESQSDDDSNAELHQFTFSIELDTGEMFTVTSAPVLVAF